MSKNRDLNDGDTFSAYIFDALEEFISTLSANFRLAISANQTSVEVAAGAGVDQVSLGMGGPWRYNSALTNAAHPGGGSGIYDVYATANANAFGIGVDNTIYPFGLAIRSRSSGIPNPPPASGATAVSRRVGIVLWDGAKITQLVRLVPVLTSTAVETRAVAEAAVSGAGVSSIVGSADFIVPVDNFRCKYTVKCGAYCQKSNTTNLYGCYLEVRLDGTVIDGGNNSRLADSNATLEGVLVATGLTAPLTAGVHTLSMSLVNDASGTAISLARLGRSIIVEFAS